MDTLNLVSLALSRQSQDQFDDSDDEEAGLLSELLDEVQEESSSLESKEAPAPSTASASAIRHAGRGKSVVASTSPRIGGSSRASVPRRPLGSNTFDAPSAVGGGVRDVAGGGRRGSNDRLPTLPPEPRQQPAARAPSSAGRPPSRGLTALTSPRKNNAPSNRAPAPRARGTGLPPRAPPPGGQSSIRTRRSAESATASFRDKLEAHHRAQAGPTPARSSSLSGPDGAAAKGEKRRSRSSRAKLARNTSLLFRGRKLDRQGRAQLMTDEAAEHFGSAISPTGQRLPTAKTEKKKKKKHGGKHVKSHRGRRSTKDKSSSAALYKSDGSGKLPTSQGMLKSRGERRRSRTALDPAPNASAASTPSSWTTSSSSAAHTSMAGADAFQASIASLQARFRAGEIARGSLEEMKSEARRFVRGGGGGEASAASKSSSSSSMLHTTTSSASHTSSEEVIDGAKASTTTPGASNKPSTTHDGAAAGEGGVGEHPSSSTSHQQRDKSKSDEPPQSKRARVIEEILHTEYTYILGLSTLKMAYYGPLMKEGKDLLSREEVKTIFSEFSTILELNKVFFSDLCQRREVASKAILEREANASATATTAATGNNEDEEAEADGAEGEEDGAERSSCSTSSTTSNRSYADGMKLADLFIGFAPLIKMYTTYICNYDDATKMVIHLKNTNKKFSEFLDDHLEAALGYTLESLLILPVQRLPRYPMLLKELIKHTPESHHDYLPLVSASKTIVEQVQFVDTKKHEMDTFLKAKSATVVRRKAANAGGVASKPASSLDTIVLAVLEARNLPRKGRVFAAVGVGEDVATLKRKKLDGAGMVQWDDKNEFSFSVHHDEQVVVACQYHSSHRKKKGMWVYSCTVQQLQHMCGERDSDVVWLELTSGGGGGGVGNAAAPGAGAAAASGKHTHAAGTAQQHQPRVKLRTGFVAAKETDLKVYTGASPAKT